MYFVDAGVLIATAPRIACRLTTCYMYIEQIKHAMMAASRATTQRRRNDNIDECVVSVCSCDAFSVAQQICIVDFVNRRLNVASCTRASELSHVICLFIIAQANILSARLFGLESAKTTKLLIAAMHIKRTIKSIHNARMQDTYG